MTLDLIGGSPYTFIGLTVVPYGTSAPELAVSPAAAKDHATQIALGNVIGSCAANMSDKALKAGVSRKCCVPSSRNAGE